MRLFQRYLMRKGTRKKFAFVIAGIQRHCSALRIKKQQFGQPQRGPVVGMDANASLTTRE